MYLRDRRIRLAILTFAVLAASLTPGLAWGPQGHTIITEHGIALLPAQIAPFYAANQRCIVALSMLPDEWRETHRETGPEHYCDLDKLDIPPFDKLRASREEVEKLFGKDKVLEMGVLPWVVQDRFGKLVAALKSKDAQSVVVQSALLAHYVGDAHVPFHASKHWDGCKPEHKGLHFRWETAMLALRLKPEFVRPQKPETVEQILSSAFNWCVDSLSHVEAICVAEDKAREKDPNHAWLYYEILARDTLPIAHSRLTKASEALAGVYIAAWEQAGKPELPAKSAALFWGQ
jgi:hypothetical protein